MSVKALDVPASTRGHGVLFILGVDNHHDVLLKELLCNVTRF